MADKDIGAFGRLFGKLQPGLRHFEKQKLSRGI
jgi:hypothetical protein